MKIAATFPSLDAQSPSQAEPEPDFLALNRPCAERWREVEKRPELVDPKSPLGALLALRRQLGELPHRRKLSALLVYFLSRAAEQPLALARATLEWARQQSLETGDSTKLDEVAHLLATTALAELGPKAGELGKLLAAYQADDVRFNGDVVGAEAALDDLLLSLEEFSDREIRAQILEISSDLSSHIGRLDEAAALLDRAEAELDGLVLPGRRASLFLRRGRLAIRDERAADAIAPLLAALSDMPIGVDARLRLEAGHCLVGAYVGSADFAEAERVLDAIESSYALWAQDRALEAQRNWLKGRIFLRTGRASDAEPVLDRSLAILQENAQLQDAFLVYADLLDAWQSRGCPEERGPFLVDRLQKLLKAPEIVQLGYLETQRLVDRAKKLGLELPELKRLLGRLWGLDRWVH